MKQLTVSGGRFGPFAEVVTLGDRYRCDGEDYQFSVIGAATVDDWNGPLPERNVVVVPDSVTKRQAVRAMYDAGILDEVEALVAALPRVYQLEWIHASVVERTNPLFDILRQQLGLTSAQADDLLIAASAI